MMKLDQQNWTFSALESWLEVSKIARSKNHKITNIYHLFISLWERSSSNFLEFIDNRGLAIKARTIHAIVDKFAKKNPDMFLSSQMEPFIQKEIENCVNKATQLAEKRDNLFIGTEHFIWAILESSEKFCDCLLENGIDTEHFKNCIEAFLKNDALSIEDGEEEVEELEAGEVELDSREEQMLNESQINRFCTLLNDTVSKSNFGVISGRDKEIGDLEEILSCKIKSNCIYTCKFQ